MHDTPNDSIKPTDRSVHKETTLEETDLLRLQLNVAYLGMAKQEQENLQLKMAAAQQRGIEAETEMRKFQAYLKQKYGLVEGVDQLNYASGEIKRGGRGEEE